MKLGRVLTLTLLCKKVLHTARRAKPAQAVCQEVHILTGWAFDQDYALLIGLAGKQLGGPRTYMCGCVAQDDAGGESTNIDGATSEIRAYHRPRT